MSNYNDVMLIEYILGNIDEKQDSKLAELLKQKGIDKQIKQLSEDLGVFNQTTPLKPSKQLRENILNRISKSKVNHQLSGFRKRLSTFFKLPLSRIDEILQATTNIISPIWDKEMIAGADLLHFDGGNGLSTADCGLIHLTPGNGVGRHVHNGDEWMLLLRGYLSCSDNNTYQPGDIIHRPKGSQHSVQNKGNQDCIFAVIADKGVTFL